MHAAIKEAATLLATAWTMSVIVVLAIICFFLQCICFVLTRPFDRNRRWVGLIFRRGGRYVITLSPTFRFRVYGAYPRQLAHPTVVVSNHISNADPFLISHLPWELKWLGKRSVFNIPFLGWCMRMAGDIPVERGNKESAQHALQRCEAYIRNGMSVCICPEGTRSATGELGAFKDGAFRLAITTQADILPLAVAGTQHAIRKHSSKIGFAKAHVMWGQAISTVGMSLDDLESLKATTRQQIEAMLKVIRPISSGG